MNLLEASLIQKKNILIYLMKLTMNNIFLTIKKQQREYFQRQEEQMIRRFEDL